MVVLVVSSGGSGSSSNGSGGLQEYWFGPSITMMEFAKVEVIVLA